MARAIASFTPVTSDPAPSAARSRVVQPVRQSLVQMVRFAQRAFDLAHRGVAARLTPGRARLVIPASRIDFGAMQRDVCGHLISQCRDARGGRLGLASLRDLAI